jgi:hypothetical protein
MLRPVVEIASDLMTGGIARFNDPPLRCVCLACPCLRDIELPLGVFRASTRRWSSGAGGGRAC